MPKWPIPPKQLAQAALGGAILAFTEIESIDELDREHGSECLHAGAIRGVRELVDREFGRTKASLERLKQIREDLSKSPAQKLNRSR
jgi:hypothetical protein